MKIAVQAWTPEYGSEKDDGRDEGPPEDLDVTAEGVGWSALSSGRQDDLIWDEVLFVDGVRRTDARLFVTPDGKSRALGGVAVSMGVGAVSLDIAAATGKPVRVAQIVREKTLRFFAVGGGHELVLSAHTSLEYAALPVPSFAPEDLDKHVHREMGRAEALCTMEVASAPGSDRLIIVDGPLDKMSPGANAVVGMIKSHSATYLEEEEDLLVSELGCGERTPFFFFGGPQRPRYSWYLRLCDPGSNMHGWHGIVRCETPASHSRETVKTLANATTCLLPRFASQPFWDARAPQNLVPIVGLERRLRHSLGDREFAYRKIKEAALRISQGGDQVA